MLWGRRKWKGESLKKGKDGQERLERFVMTRETSDSDQCVITELNRSPGANSSGRALVACFGFGFDGSCRVEGGPSIIWQSF